MTNEFSVEAGLIVFTKDGRAQFGWRDLITSRFHTESDGNCIADAVGAVEFHSDVAH